MKLLIFNPRIEMHKGVLLRLLVSAEKYQRRWPSWLIEKVGTMLRNEVDISIIRDRLLFGDYTYVELKTLKTKRCKTARVSVG